MSKSPSSSARDRRRLARESGLEAAQQYGVEVHEGYQARRELFRRYGVGVAIPYLHPVHEIPFPLGVTAAMYFDAQRPAAVWLPSPEPASAANPDPFDPDAPRHAPVPLPDITVADILKVVADYYGVTIEELRGPKRHQPLARYRQMAMYLAREMTDLSYPQLGRKFRRDHSTVIHGYRTIASQLEAKPRLWNQVLDLRDRIRLRRLEQLRRDLAAVG